MKKLLFILIALFVTVYILFLVLEKPQPTPDSYVSGNEPKNDYCDSHDCLIGK